MFYKLTDNIEIYAQKNINNKNIKICEKLKNTSPNLLIETDEDINDMYLTSKYLSKLIFKLVNNNSSKIYFDFFSGKIELSVSNKNSNNYIMNLHFNLKSYDKLIENENEFHKEFLKLNLPYLISFNTVQVNDFNTEIHLTYSINKININKFITDLFYFNYVNIIEFFIEYVSLFADDYNRFINEIDCLLDYKNFFEKINEKTFKRLNFESVFN